MLILFLFIANFLIISSFTFQAPFLPSEVKSKGIDNSWLGMMFS